MKYFFVNNTKINYIPNNRSIIEYCENLGINIPHYCYHPKLSIAGNCRMCLVEVKNSPKPVISCAMSILNKMEIFTNSPLVKKSREGVLEFLLLNHPLDCPVCDQGGECDLQDQSFVFGINKKRFYNFKRIVTDKNIGPVVKTVMTRCIHCTRCVRFSQEVAGVESLGIFGRGVNSEIGTYVTKIFNSELSGNIIDICPVGALTSKQYPFVSRIWELKSFKTIDYSDSMCSTIQVYTKSNSIIKVLPDYEDSLNNNNWISDKTRFSFDGMFSPDRLVSVFLSGGRDNSKETNWNTIFKNIESTVYFQDHLCRHRFLNFNVHVLFNNNISIESLCLLSLLDKQYSFLILRKFDNFLCDIDNEMFFLLNSFVKLEDLNKSELCLMINTNTRYESPSINIKLRQRYLKGNFKVFFSGPFLDLTYPTKFLGATPLTVNNLTEGTSPVCQDYINAKDPTLLISSHLIKRKDSGGLISSLKKFFFHAKAFNKNMKGYNLLNSGINESGVSLLNRFQKFNSLDFSSTSGLVFIDFNFNSIEFSQMINSKLINLFNLENKNKFLVDLQSIASYSFGNKIKKDLNLSALFNLPNKTFFEDSNIFYNNVGIFKKTVKIIPSKTKSKQNWQIIRKLISIFSNTNFSSDLIKKKVNFNYQSNLSFIKYVNFHFFPVSSMEHKTLFYKEFHSFKNNALFFNVTLKSKFYVTKYFFWLEDFYLGGKDHYSKFSSVMIHCSKSFRSDTVNFKYII